MQELARLKLDGTRQLDMRLQVRNLDCIQDFENKFVIYKKMYCTEEEERMAVKYVHDTEMAKAKRDFELKKATYDLEVNTKVKLYKYVPFIYKQKYKTEGIYFGVLVD